MAPRNLYIVATGQHVGKTTISLGLMHALMQRGLRVHFFKPVGQQTVERQGVRIDKDAVLIQSALSIESGLAKMSPVTVPKGFVEGYLFNRNVEPLKRAILESYQQVAQGCDVIVIEGTGHAGVGSCLDLSNAEVASLLGAQALMVVEGGVGSTIDEVMLDEWEDIMKLNMRTAFLICRGALRVMRKQSFGRIVNIAAMPALSPSAKKGPYAISKRAVVTLTETIAEETKGTGITANAIAPSIILTEANKQSMPKADSSKWVTPQEIAQLILYLCSDEAKSVSGNVIKIYGGV